MSPVASSGARHVNTSANKLDLTLTQTCKPCWLCWKSEWRGQYTDLYSFHKSIKNLCYENWVLKKMSPLYWDVFSFSIVYPPIRKLCVCPYCPHVCAQHGSEVVVVTQTGARWVSASMTLYDIVRHSVTNDAFCDNYQCDGSLWQIHTISFCGAIIDCAGWDRSPEYNVSTAPIINSLLPRPGLLFSLMPSELNWMHAA